MQCQCSNQKANRAFAKQNIPFSTDAKYMLEHSTKTGEVTGTDLGQKGDALASDNILSFSGSWIIWGSMCNMLQSISALYSNLAPEKLTESPLIGLPHQCVNIPWWGHTDCPTAFKLHQNETDKIYRFHDAVFHR